jgi:hypothetical protein
MRELYEMAKMRENMSTKEVKIFTIVSIIFWYGMFLFSPKYMEFVVSPRHEIRYPHFHGLKVHVIEERGTNETKDDDIESALVKVLNTRKALELKMHASRSKAPFETALFIYSFFSLIFMVILIERNQPNDAFHPSFLLLLISYVLTMIYFRLAFYPFMSEYDSLPSCFLIMISIPYIYVIYKIVGRLLIKCFKKEFRFVGKDKIFLEPGNVIFSMFVSLTGCLLGYFSVFVFKFL